MPYRTGSFGRALKELFRMDRQRSAQTAEHGNAWISPSPLNRSKIAKVDRCCTSKLILGHALRDADRSDSSSDYFFPFHFSAIPCSGSKSVSRCDHDFLVAGGAIHSSASPNSMRFRSEVLRLPIFPVGRRKIRNQRTLEKWVDQLVKQVLIAVGRVSVPKQGTRASALAGAGL